MQTIVRRPLSEFEAGADAGAGNREQDISNGGKAGIFVLATHKNVWRECDVHAAADGEAIQELSAFPGTSIRPYAASRSDENRRRAELWESFCEFVRLHHGWITSPPGSRVAVLETERGNSTLPQKLVKLGYEVTEIANGERLTGGGLSLTEEKLKRQGYAINAAGPTMQVSRFEIALPWAAPPPPPMKKRPV